VRGSLVHRHFCRIGAGRVPDAKTLVRLGQLLSGQVLERLLARTVSQAVEHKVTRGRKLRIDTTVIDAPIRHPTDSGLCEDVVRVCRRELSRLDEAGVTLPFKLQSVRRSVARRCREIGQALRRRGASRSKALQKPYRGLLRITSRLIRQAAKAVDATRQQLGRKRGARRRAAARAMAELEALLPLGRRVVQQTRARVLRGQTRSDDKLVSIFEPHARILRRGKLRKPTEFGSMALVREVEGGIVTGVDVVTEHDTALLAPSVEQHVEQFDRSPQLVAVDRGFYSEQGERHVRDVQRVKRPVIPKPGYRSAERIAHERKRWFRKGRAWRSGGEARIGRLKNTFGMATSRYRGPGGPQRTARWAAIANNLAAIAARVP
jgi:IS5 family transposase